MKKLSIAILLCVFTMPAQAKYEPPLKGPVGSALFCTSAKESANEVLNTYRNFGKMAVENFRGVYKGRKGNLEKMKKYRWWRDKQDKEMRRLTKISTIYNAWCK